MIREIKIQHLEWKKNWIDQNKVVFGYDDTQACCEEWGWGVYDPETREKVAESPDGMPYHFDFEGGAKTAQFDASDGLGERFALRDEWIDQLDCVRVRLLPDDGTDGKPLVFEAYTNHNGYYLHDFSFEKDEDADGDSKADKPETDTPRYALPPMDESTMKQVEADHQRMLDLAADFAVRFRDAVDPHLPVKMKWLSEHTPIEELMNGSEIAYMLNDLEAAFGIYFPTAERGDALDWSLWQLHDAVMRNVCNKSEVEKKEQING